MKNLITFILMITLVSCGTSKHKSCTKTKTYRVKTNKQKFNSNKNNSSFNKKRHNL